jgi:hypothetical protein
MPGDDHARPVGQAPDRRVPRRPARPRGRRDATSAGRGFVRVSDAVGYRPAGPRAPAPEPVAARRRSGTRRPRVRQSPACGRAGMFRRAVEPRPRRGREPSGAGAAAVPVRAPAFPSGRPGVTTRQPGPGLLRRPRRHPAQRHRTGAGRSGRGVPHPPAAGAPAFPGASPRPSARSPVDPGRSTAGRQPSPVMRVSGRAPQGTRPGPSRPRLARNGATSPGPAPPAWSGPHGPARRRRLAVQAGDLCAGRAEDAVLLAVTAAR